MNEKFQRLVEQNAPEVIKVHSERYFTWTWPNIGFGELNFYLDADDRFTINDECMGKEAARKLMYAFADYVVDHSNLK
jgi:hypothetical protein